MATAAEIQVAYKAIYRTDLNATVAAAIANSGISVDAYVAQQLPQVAATTQAAVAIASFVTGTAPTSDKLDALKVAADAQVASYTALGSSNPQLGAFEAFGRSFATDSTTTAGFNTKYGALSTADFVAVVYAQVYGTQPTAAAAANLTAQINYFTNLYTVNGVANASLAAKGAVLGQIVGYAFTSSASANSNLDNQVQSLLTSAAKGDTTVYNKALPTAVDAGAIGVTITLVAGADTVSPSAADPAFKSTANNDTIRGQWDSADLIDGSGGDDTLNATVIGNVTVATNGLVSVETVNATSTAASVIDMDKAVGYKTVGVVDGTAAVSYTNLAAGTKLAVTDTTPTNGTVVANSTFALKDATGTSDVADLTVNGVAGAATITLTGYETVNLTASGADSVVGGAGFSILDANLKTLNITATKAATVTLNSAVLESITGTGAGAVTITNVSDVVKTIDFSGATGNVSVADVGDAAISIKGGSGADTFGDIKVNKAVVTGGAGNDTITFAQANATDTATVTGGTGGDVINLGASKVTAVYLAANESNLSNVDQISNFTTANDKLDLKALALAGDKTNLGTFTATALVDQGDYFNGKAVTYGSVTSGGVTDWYVLADANNNGKFDLATDLAIKIVGGAAGSVVFGDLVLA